LAIVGNEGKIIRQSTLKEGNITLLRGVDESLFGRHQSLLEFAEYLIGLGLSGFCKNGGAAKNQKYYSTYAFHIRPLEPESLFRQS
jgi:hypothetical protein